MSISNAYLSTIKERALKAKDKKALYGPDIDLSRFTQHMERGRIESLEGLSQRAKEAAILTGMNCMGEFYGLIGGIGLRTSDGKSICNKTVSNKNTRTQQDNDMHPFLLHFFSKDQVSNGE